MEEIHYARPLHFLKELTVTGNPIMSYRSSRLHVIFMIPQLEVLNGGEVTADENVNAGNLHGADAEGLKAIRQKYFPDGELDDGGGAVVPVSAGLLASNGLDAKVRPFLLARERGTGGGREGERGRKGCGERGRGRGRQTDR